MEVLIDEDFAEGTGEGRGGEGGAIGEATRDREFSCGGGEGETA